VIKRISLVTCLFALLPINFSHSDTHILDQKNDEPSAIRELLQIHKKFIEVTSKGDADGMGALVSDDYSITGVDGQKADRAKALEAVRQNSGVVVMEETDVNTRLIDGAGVVTGLINWKAGTGEREVKGKVRFTEVWRKSSRGWKLVVAQATNVKD
jgi:ketosteroid isomerase-like protein